MTSLIQYWYVYLSFIPCTFRNTVLTAGHNSPQVVTYSQLLQAGFGFFWKKPEETGESWHMKHSPHAWCKEIDTKQFMRDISYKTTLNWGEQATEGDNRLNSLKRRISRCLFTSISGKHKVYPIYYHLNVIHTIRPLKYTNIFVLVIILVNFWTSKCFDLHNVKELLIVP